MLETGQLLECLFLIDTLYKAIIEIVSENQLGCANEKCISKFGDLFVYAVSS